MRSLIIVASLALVLISAGCVSQLTDVFGSDVIDISRIDQSPGLNDLVSLESARFLPEKNAYPEQEIRFFANIVSHETDPGVTLDGVYFEVYDATQFKNEDGTVLCNSDVDPRGITTCQADVCTFGKMCDLSAGETQTLDIKLRAPLSRELANVRTPISLNYRVRYHHTSISNYNVVVVSRDEILRLQQEGKKLSQTVYHVSNAGPIQLVFEETGGGAFGTPERTMFLSIKAINLGNGAPVGNKLTSLKVTLPPGLGVIEDAPDGFVFNGNELIFTGGDPSDPEELKLIKQETIP